LHNFNSHMGSLIAEPNDPRSVVALGCPRKRNARTRRGIHGDVNQAVTAAAMAGKSDSTTRISMGLLRNQVACFLA